MYSAEELADPPERFVPRFLRGLISDLDSVDCSHERVDDDLAFGLSKRLGPSPCSIGVDRTDRRVAEERIGIARDDRIVVDDRSGWKRAGATGERSELNRWIGKVRDEIIGQSAMSRVGGDPEMKAA